MCLDLGWLRVCFNNFGIYLIDCDIVLVCGYFIRGVIGYLIDFN